MPDNSVDSPRRRKLLATVGASAVAYGVGVSATAAQSTETIEATLDNVGTSAWEVTETTDDGLAETGVGNPELTLQVGTRYTVQNNGWSAHPLALRGSGGEVLLSQDGQGSFEGDSETDWVDNETSVSFTVTGELADKLDNYVCTAHGSMAGSIRTVQESDSDAPAAVTFSDQSTDGTSVTVDSARLDEGGFVTIHDSTLQDGEALGSVRGTSEYIEVGSVQDLAVELDTPLAEGDTLFAMAHRDSNDNETYDFVTSEGGADGPYRFDGNAVIDDADVQVDGSAAVQLSDQQTGGAAVTVDYARLDDGGFVTIHDSTLLDGEALGSVRGTSEYLEAGSVEDLEVELDDPLEETGTLIAMPHRDTNDNETYDFVTSEGGADGPYTRDGDAVVDSAEIQVAGEAAVLLSEQTTDGSTVVVDYTRVDSGGFVTIHDSTLLDGEALGSVRGTSEYLDAGTVEDLEIELEEPLEDDGTLIAMPHRDTNGNETYDFVTSEGGADGPYTFDGNAVTNSAEITVEGMGDGMDGDDGDDSMDGDGMDGDDGSGGSDGDDSADDSGPGFGPIAGAAGLSGLAAYAYRKLNIDAEPATPDDDDLNERTE